ncbi:MAG: alanine dehydrogenase [Deltaproteobacteria bacterium]|nr:MAG: alanine dehydrogenase [Deltaproteobacteria bacterium]
MKIGVPTEVKSHEGRVALVPSGVRQLCADGHEVTVQAGAGLGSTIEDAAYVEAGARIARDADAVWRNSDMIIKVKEPVAEEYDRIQPRQTLFTYIHLAAVPALAPVLIERQVAAVAYETIQLVNGYLPLLQPMSEVAGKMSVQIGANLLEKERGGKGILLGGVPGVRRGRVVILGGGTVGMAAAKVAVGLGAEVTVIDCSVSRLGYLDDVFGSRLNLLHSNPDTIASSVRRSDLLIGAVLVPGARAPKLVTRELVSSMDNGSVIVDVAVDQGGCIETIHGTTHDAPTYSVDGVLHYGVTNMPGAVAQTSTFALSNVTLPYALKLAKLGPIQAARQDAALALGFNTFEGAVTHLAVADSLNLPFRPLFA